MVHCTHTTCLHEMDRRFSLTLHYLFVSLHMPARLPYATTNSGVTRGKARGLTAPGDTLQGEVTPE